MLWNPATVSPKRRRIAELARQSPEMAFTSLAHLMDIDWLHEAYRLTRKSGAVGVDGQSAGEYAVNLESNLRSLLERAKSGTYQAPPVRRVHIPKGSGHETRPIGIPTFEDKVLQRAVLMVLEPMYEQDFLDCSYGFRPRRSAHDALDSLRKQVIANRGGWILEMDIRKCFDTLDHGHLREFLQRRVRDGVLLRLLGKWLRAGVLEDGGVSYPEAGSPQGGVVSPLLANIYLHEVLDRWFERDVKPRMRGRAFLIRFADDAVLGFASRADALRVLEVLPKRFGKYGLTVHPDKTRLVPFLRPPQGGRQGTRPGTFPFLGFTHYWGRSREGYWVMKRKTASDRLRRALHAIADWCRHHRHLSVRDQHATLCQKMRGHYEYYGMTGNSRSLSSFRFGCIHIWRKWLSRRHRQGLMPWSRYERLLARYPLARVVVVHSVYRRVANP